MKRIILFFSLLLIFVGMVSAGSVEDLDVKYKDRNLFWDGTRWTEVNDDDVFIDADLLAGEDLTSYVHEQEAAWSKDLVGGSGMSHRDLWGIFTGSRDLYEKFDTLVEYLFSIFATKTEVENSIENVQERIDILEATVNVMHPVVSLEEQEMIDLLAALKKARRTGETQTVGQYKCVADLDACVLME